MHTFLRFLPGDYIMTRSGERGYVIDACESTGYYEVRLQNRYVVLAGEELRESDSFDENCS